MSMLCRPTVSTLIFIAGKIIGRRLGTQKQKTRVSNVFFDLETFTLIDGLLITCKTEELFEFKLKNVMDAEAIWNPLDNPCTEMEEDEDGEEGMLSAFTTESVSNTKDFITICDDSWDEWEYRLPSKKDGGLAGLKGEFLDELLTDSPEATFLHELTHAKAVFGDGLMGKFVTYSLIIAFPLFPSLRYTVHSRGY